MSNERVETMRGILLRTSTSVLGTGMKERRAGRFAVRDMLRKCSLESFQFNRESPKVQVAAGVGFGQAAAGLLRQSAVVSPAVNPGGASDAAVGVKPEPESGFMGQVVLSTGGSDSEESGEIGNRLPFFFTSPR